MESVTGLDLHDKKTVFLANNENGELLCKGVVETSASGLRLLRDKYHLPPGMKIGMESGTHAFFVARHLLDLGYVPIVIHAEEVRKKKARQKQKDDMRDAREICKGLQSGYYEQIVHIPDLKYQQLRQFMSLRRHFINARSNEIRVAKHAMRRAGVSGMCKTLQSTNAWKKLIERLTNAEESLLASQMEAHLAVWQINHDQVMSLDEKIKQHLDVHEELNEDKERLKTIPGVGDIVALTAIGVFADIKRFKNAKKASSYTGLVTETNHSANSKKFGHITKEGSPELRSMLVEAAHHANKASHALNPFFSRLRARKGYKVAVVAAAHRLCRIMFAMLRDKKEFEESKVHSQHKPGKETKRYRLKTM